MGAAGSTLWRSGLSTYLLDTTVLVAHLRGDAQVADFLLALVRDGHTLATSCVSIAEVERGIQPKEERATASLLRRLKFLDTDPEAAKKAGRYQAEWRKRGHTIHVADALIAGTARAHGAIVLTDNVKHFPMRDIRVIAPPSARTSRSHRTTAHQR